MPLSPEFRLVKKSDAARIFDVCLRTIDNYIDSGLLPEPVGFGSKEYWHPEIFETFLAKTFKLHDESVGADATVPESPDSTGNQVLMQMPRAAVKRHSTATSRAHPTARALTRQRSVLDRLNQPALSDSASCSNEP